MRKCLFFIVVFFTFYSVKGQTADFTFQSTTGLFCNPSTITFNQTCTGNPGSFIWDFGNGNYGSNSIETNTYTTGGTYTVKLTAIFKNSVLEISKSIVINPTVTVSVAADKDYLCQPGIMNFIASSNSTIVNYDWSFGNTGIIDNNKTNAVSHLFPDYGVQTVSVTGTSTTGCSANSTINIQVKKLAISATASRINGCVPAIVNFRANVTPPRNSSVSSYVWDFNDGSPLITTPNNTITKTYPLVGQYAPKVTATTSEGCTNTILINNLAFGSPPLNHVVSVVKNPICGSETAVFKTSAINANRYYWDFGDGTSLSSSDIIVSHKYTTVGKKTVIVRAYYNECSAAISVVTSINIIGVIAKYNNTNSCDNKNVYLFDDISNGNVTNRLWTYGDNYLLNDTTKNSIHTYPTSGQFLSKLFVTDSLSGCSDSITNMIYTATPSLFNTDSVICKNTLTTFSIINNYTNPASQYTWNVVGFINGPGPLPSITSNANILGNFDNFVVINYGPGTCNDTVRLKRKIFVRGPNLDYSMPSTLCLNKTLEITNNSKPFVAADTFATSFWNYGNSVNKDTIYQPLPVKYNSPGTYAVKLITIDINGCQDSLVKNVAVNPIPFLYIIPSMDTICYNTTVNLIAFHNQNIVWSPAATLSCTSCDTAIAKPLISTRYFCTSTNIYGCAVEDTSYITVSIPFTAIINPANIYICLKDSTQVEVNPKGKIVSWSPTTGLSNANSYNPEISPVQNTIYTVTLSDSTGCLTNSSKASVAINVKSLPTVNAGPDRVLAKGEAYSLTPVYSNNVQNYLWTPSVLLSCSDCADPNGVNTVTQQYHIKITSDSGCVATDSIIISIECKYANLMLPTAFTPNNDNLNDYFYPISNGIKMISKFIIYNRGGKVVFEASNFSPNSKTTGWNGTYRGAKQSAESYVYVLEAICDLGEKLFKRGSVILIR